ncbi:MAG: alpha/beta hydrolase [Candidatus Binataceae bacterium]
MALDPQMKAMLDMAAAANLPPMHTLTPEQGRLQMAKRLAPRPPVAVAHVEDRRIPGPGGEIPIRIYTPEGRAPFGVFVYFHGGGWVLGDIAMTDQPCRILANASGCIVVSVEYRLAPEHKFPAAPEDCHAATRWVAENAPAINADHARLAVGGTSAGATLATVTAMMARDRGGPRLAYQLLVYPATSSAMDSPSQKRFAQDQYYVLSRADMKWFWDHYLAGDADRENPYACPAHARNLRGLPPALVITAEYDPLRDEGEAYAARLRQEGVPVVLRRYDGMTHGFFGMPDFLDQAKAAIAEAGSALRAAIG